MALHKYDSMCSLVLFLFGLHIFRNGIVKLSYFVLRARRKLTENNDNMFQWEFQIGPCEGVTIGDHLYVARYILYRLAEMYGLRVTFSPIPVPGEAFMSSGHINFSTSRMRQNGGME